MKKIIVIGLLFVFYFESNHAQTFENFIKKFQSLKLPLKINRKIIYGVEWNIKLFKQLSIYEIENYIVKPIKDTSDYFKDKANVAAGILFTNDSTYNFLSKEGQELNKFFFYGKLPASKYYQPVIIYHQSRYQGLEFNYFYLIIYSKDGKKIVDAIQFASKELYMTNRIHEGTFLPDSSIIIKELDFYTTELDYKQKSNFIVYYYLKYIKEGKFKSTQLEKFPYSGSYINQANGDVIDVDQNVNGLFVTYQIAGQNVACGMEIIENDLKTGTISLLFRNGIINKGAFYLKENKLILIDSESGIKTEWIRNN